MSAGQAKLELLLELKNKIRGGLSSARQELSKGMSSMKSKMMEFREGTSGALEAVSGQIPGVGGALSMLANPYAAAAAGAVALGAAYVKSVSKAAEWEKGMAKVNVTAQLSKKELSELSGKVMDIAADNGAALSEAPDAFNTIISAGLDAKEAIQAFGPILKGAKAGFTDVKVVADATVSTMNSTGWKSATDVLDVLFATMNKGKAEFADIADYLPKIIPMAQKAGQSFQDTAGAFAYLTSQGFKSEAAATGLENVFKAISDPRVTDGFKKVGVDIYDATGKARPMLNIIKDLKNRLDGLSDKEKAGIFKTIGLDGEATTAIGAMLKDYDKLAEIIKFTNSSQGQLNEAIKNAETPMDVWRVVMSQIDKAMIGIGQTGLPIIKSVGLYVLDTIKYFKDLWNQSALFRDTIAGVGNIIYIAFKMAIRGPLMLWNTIKGVGDILGWLGEKVGLGTGSFTSMYETVRPYLLYIWEFSSKIADIWYKFSTYDFSGALEAMANFKMPSLSDIINQSDNEILEHKIKTPGYGQIQKGAIPAMFGIQQGFQFFKEKKENSLAPKPTKPASPTAPNTPTSTNGTNVTGKAEQVKNLTINMDSMFKMGNVSSSNSEVSKMGKREWERWFEEMCVRMIRNMETSYS